jgi:tripartite ATP-independent transporter DctM subunit
MLTPLFIVFIILMLIGLPIAFALGLSSIVALLSEGNVPLMIVPQRIFTALDHFALLAVPLFILAGEIMNRVGLTERVLRFASALVGHIRGSLGQVNIVSSMFFAGISGSATADAAGMGSMLIPAMQKKGYDNDYAVVVTATSSCIGPIIPPSILMIVYASVTGLSVGTLFIAGIVPGILLGLFLMIASYIYARKRNYEKNKRASLKELILSFASAWTALAIPFIIIGGILSGVFTATEAGVVAVMYGLILGFVTGNLTFKGLKPIFISASITSAITLIILASASIFAWILTREQLPIFAADTLLSISTNPAVVYGFILLFLLIIGLFMDPLAAMLIVVPVLEPIRQSMGYDPIVFAIVVILTLLIGAITPPVGSLTFVCCGIAKVKVSEVIGMIWPYVGVMVLCVIVIAAFPSLTLFFVDLFGK